MAGHNKWSQIKHRKARVDKQRSKVWSSVARDLIVAARRGGGDPNANIRLSYAIAEAKKHNMPADTIARAIKRGTGELEGTDPEELVYEGYGPGGIALMVTALTDNRNRTAPLVKRVFEHHGGKPGAQGSVAYLFQTKARVCVAAQACPEEILIELALEAGADDVATDDPESFEILGPPASLDAIKDALRSKGIEWESAERAPIPNAVTILHGEEAKRILDLIEELEGLEDVQSVAGNFDISDEVLAG